ncbi:MAG: hypothetical protein IT447_15550 [Phycisphaerales bacterium]|jgi:hypothetical protein|nr:hypothetical protein [Phycisphaerales bacterium]
MLDEDIAISRFRRDLLLGMVVRALLLAGALVAIGVAPFSSRLDGGMLLLIVGGIWLALSYQSMKGSRLAARSPSLIAMGDFDEAERQIEEALRSFSIFRAAKLMSLHHLAMLRHAQRRWQESAMLAKAVLRQRLGALRGLSRSMRLILADSLLEMDDTHGAYQAISGLYNERLALGEAMNLQLVQLDYLWRIRAWQEMFHNVAAKVQLAELMPTGGAARSQALMALAARKVGREDWTAWLMERAQLLVDPFQLVLERPVLAELWTITPQTTAQLKQ